MPKHVLNNNIRAFLALVRAGLWEIDTQLMSFEPLDSHRIHQLAQEQAVVGLVISGVEHAKDIQFPKDIVLSMVGETLKLEQRNTAMNTFISMIVKMLHEKVMYPLLVKGQGIAQCYERPLWRACGDIDLLIDKPNYDKAVLLLHNISEHIGEEKKRRKDRLHSEFYMGEWIVELHGSLHACLSNRMDRVLDEIQDEVFSETVVRYWQNGKMPIALPAPDNDVIIVFTHILQHLFLEGIGLRQICDLARLLWTFRDEIDKDKLYSRLSKMGIISEWKVFGCLMVDYLGLREEAMPFYERSYKKKAQRILCFILEVGNFGHNRDMSHLKIEQPLIRKAAISWNHLKDCIQLSRVFPLDASRFFCRFMIDGFTAAIK